MTTKSGAKDKATPPRQCAKCRDRKHWSKREEFRGTHWHWYLWKGETTALAKKCMLREGRNER